VTAPAPPPAELEHRSLGTNGIRLHTVLAGPEDGPLVVLLHGFPELWYGWRHQIGALAAAGFRVAAPDQRGYNLSDKPAGVRAYGLDDLALDVVGILDALGRETASVVGHDWGGAVAWWLGMRHADRIARLALLNIPHPKVLERNLWRNPAQLYKSLYMLFFQIPRLPELLLARQDWKIAVNALRSTSRPGTFCDADLAVYRAAWSQPGAMTAMLHWYRAALRARPHFHRPHLPQEPRDRRVQVPTLLIWGMQDGFLGAEMAQPSIDLCAGGRLVFFEEATHWVHHEEPERVNRLLLGFLGGSAGFPGP
jgi:pimeloyl-ACP methyl ester carboxylesterase